MEGIEVDDEFFEVETVKRNNVFLHEFFLCVLHFDLNAGYFVSALFFRCEAFRHNVFLKLFSKSLNELVVPYLFDDGMSNNECFNFLYDIFVGESFDEVIYKLNFF
mgnify:CR=1 FL=1